MNASLAQKAVSEALNGHWDEAVKTNLQIIKEDSKDIDAHNRLARAYAETGQIKKAKETAQKTLKIDPVNPIAQKSLEKWKNIKKSSNHTSIILSSESFLEEPGKTRLIGLIHPGDAEILAGLSAGEPVNLLTHPHRVSVVASDGKYIGRLPDDLAARLRRLIKGGNKYLVLIKSVEDRNVKVFMRETFKSKENETIMSFPTEKIEYVAFTPPGLVHKSEPEMGNSEEVTPD